MQTKLNSGLLAIVIVLSIATAPAYSQTLPPIPKALSDLMRLDGKWQGTTSHTTEGKVYTFTYYLEFRKIADGRGMYMEEWFTSPELGSLKGFNVIGYNSNDEKIHWSTVDNFGTTHEHFGTWKSPDHFFMEAVENINGKKFSEKVDATFNADNTLGLLEIVTIDGKETGRTVAKFHRTN